MTFQTIVEEIMATHHSLLKRELPKLSTLFAELAAHDPHNSAIAEAQQIYTKVRNKVETHLRDEETALFPNGIALERGGNVVGTEFDQEQRLDEMEKEHDGCGKTLTSIQQMLQTAVPASELRDQIITNIQIIQDDFVAHVEKENTIVHPMLREFLTARQSPGN